MTNPVKKPSIRRKFLYILVSSIILLVGLIFIFNAIISSKNNSLLTERLREAKNYTDAHFQDNTSTQKNYVFDNSYWDGLIEYYKTKDSAWIYDNFLLGLPKYNIDYIWFEDKNLNTVKSFNSVSNREIDDFEIESQAALADKLHQSPFSHFFTKAKGELIEVYTAPVQPSNDVDRKTPAQGYIIIGIAVDSSYLQSLIARNDGTHFSISGSFINDTVDNKLSRTLFSKSLDGMNGKPLVYLKVEKLYPDLKRFEGEVFLYSSLFLLFVVVILVSFYLLAANGMYKPLEQIYKSLQTNSRKPVEQLSEKQNEFGEVARLVKSSFDYEEELLQEIETRKKSEYDLQEALYKVETSTIGKIKAEQAAAAKTEFLSTISHEIRTPINGVIGIINLLKEEELNNRQKEYVNILDFSSKHLLSLISDVLDFSKIETGKIEFEKNSFDIRHLTNNIYKLFKARADEKRIDFKFSPAADVTTSLYGDNLRLGQILTNLLGNAIKFTNNGYVHFGYKVISNNASHITFEFFIKDTGIGMDEEEQRRIFESFSQANVKVSREYGGTGLGLTISKKLIDMQGGSISVVSRKNVGSTFSFVITYEKHAFVSSLPQPSTKKMVSQNLQGLKVLVAEDNKINSFVLQKFLNIWNVEVQFAVTGVEALRFVQEDDFDLILMDLQMPELDGQQATTAIRALEDKKINRIPIVALTADASVSTQELLLHNGFNHFITKPFNPDALYRILKKYYNVN